MADALALAQAVCTRLCHDMGGATGALAGALELLDGSGEEAAELARDAARILDRRLRFWRAAAGGPGELDAAALAQLAEGLTIGRRLATDLTGLEPDATLPPELAQPLLIALLVGTEAMPRGGTLRVAGGPASGLTVWPDGPGAAWPAGLAALIAGEPPPITPRGVGLPLLAATIAAGGVRLELLMAGKGASILMLTPRATP